MSSHEPRQSRSPSPIRIGLFGAGGWARENHIPAISYVRQHHAQEFDVELVALCERDPASAEKARAACPIRRVYDGPEGFLEDPDINCFVVIVRLSSLRSVVELVAPRGLPVFSEKPPGLTYDDARHLADLVRVPNVVAFNRRYFPIVRRFSKLLASGSDIYYVRAGMFRNERYDSVPSRGHEPFVLGTGVHLINLLEHLFGPIVSASSRGVEVRANKTWGWLTDLRFDSGLPGRMDLLPCSGSESERIEAHGRDRSLYLWGCQYGLLEPPGRIEIHRNGRQREVIDGDPSLPSVVAAGFVDEYLDFFRAVRDGSPTRSSFKTSAETMRIAQEIEVVSPTGSSEVSPS